MSQPLLLFLLTAIPLTIAIAIDLTIGDPSEGSLWERLYPPVLVGRLGKFLADRIERGSPRRERVAGALAWIVTVGSAVALSLVFLRFTEHILMNLFFVIAGNGYPSILPILMGLFVLAVTVLWVKSLFTLSGLVRYSARVLGLPLEGKRWETAKMVNRETSSLSDELLNSAVIESLAENTTDSVVSPMLFYWILFLPGMVIYRATNTLDALIGHRTRRWAYVGEFAATLDHYLNIPGDYLTALLLFQGGGEEASIRTTGEGVHVPRSIVSMSRILRVRLEREGSYVVGEAWPAPTDHDVRRAIGKVKRASYVAFLLTYGVMGVMAFVGWNIIA